ncbi:MAG TPA: sulfite exporter TauE/SafE family protein [Bradyrhizobium sp.]|nr:sulfite exporter TauE/SafE family protein [Bradyrhizobium sp.]
MDGTVLGFFLLATFIGGLTSGLAGFAMGLVVSGIWLHIITPIQTATLIVGYGLLTQSYAIWKLRHALSWRNVAPFIVGGAIGVPIGTMLLTYINPAYLRTGIGLLLVLYSTYSLVRPVFKPVQSRVPADVGIGFLNGLLGGLTGLTGIVVTIWCQLRGWPKDVQRTVFQPVNLAAIVISAISLSIAGTVTAETGKLYLLGLPVMLAGLWGGFKLYGKLGEAAFRKVILLFLLVSGLTLIVPASVFQR